jgi:protein SCO1/2
MKKLSFLLFGLLAAACVNKEKRLPILGNREPVTKEVDGKTVTDTIYQSIPEFSFLNQDSVLLTDKDFDGKIYVADFFFTRCPSICPVMHRNMLNVYKAFKGNPDIKILSHSIDPEYDQPSILKRYATKLGVTGNQWEFVTGNKDSIYSIATKSYLVAAAKDEHVPGGYVHQGYFVLIDKDKHLRGAYDGTDPKQVDQLIKDIGILRNEYKDQE